MPARAYEVRYSIDGWHHASVRYGKTVVRTRYDALLGLRDAYPDTSFCDIRVRFLGVQATPQEVAEQAVARFNALYPIGTRVRVHPLIDEDSYSYCTVVRAPGAFVLPSGHPVVKVTGNAFAIEAVFAITGGTQP